MDSNALLQLRVQEHQKSVQRIAAQVKDFHARKVPFRLYHGSTNSTRTYEHDPKQIIDTSSLHHVIEVEKERHVAIVEPNVGMDTLVDAALKNHLVPPVVPEFPGITVGGSYSGNAGESSSWKYGFFDRTVNWVDIILADGTLVRASPEKNADLFYGATGAMGTLGVAVLFEVQLIPAKHYVETTYIPVQGMHEGVEMVKTCIASDEWDYIDGIQWGQKSGVVVAGRLSGRKEGVKEMRFTRRTDQWFYIHAQRMTKAGLKVLEKHGVDEQRDAEMKFPTELIPIRDYLFRYDRGAFWMGKYAFKMFHMRNDRGMRTILDPLMHTRTMYTALHHSGESQRFIIQDLALPEKEAEGFVDWTAQKFAIWPLWFCPLRADSKALMQNPLRVPRSPPIATNPDDPPYLINIGVWGPGRQKGRDKKELDEFVEDNRELEREVRERGGTKWLYAQTYYTADEFWAIYDKETYDALRKTWKAETLPTVFDKVKRPDGWRKMQRIRGVAKTILGHESLLGSKKSASVK